VVLTVVATLANAWRWRVVSASLRVPLAPTESVTAYYRSQFLNSVLPGGIIGDAHRGTRHGREAGDLGAGLRATVWDRVAGQMVQAGLVVLALAVLPTPLQRYSPVALVAVALVAGAAWWTGRRRGLFAFVSRDLRVLLRPAVSGRLALASCVSTAAHTAVFTVALHSVGADVGATLVLPLALLVLVGAAIPLNVAGWGPREGVTAAVFGLAGLSSADGLTVSVVFGVLSAVATVPGLLVLLADVVVRRRRAPEPAPRPLQEVRHG
jgi:glycosyltransferase 2 family protein